MLLADEEADQGGAVGFLIGEEHKGMSCMFAMMNAARLGVAMQGVAMAERAFRSAAAYAASAGRARPDMIHPDVRRTLLTMRALAGRRGRAAMRPPWRSTAAPAKSEPRESGGAPRC